MHPSEAKLMALLKLAKKAKASELAIKLELSKDVVGRIAYSLSKKNLLKIEKITSRKINLTKEGKHVKKEGLPEKLILNKLPAKPDKFEGLESIALNWALKRGWAEMKNGKAIKIVETPPVTEEETAIKQIKGLKPEDRGFKLLKKRKWVAVKDKFDYIIEITEDGLNASIEKEVTSLTSSILKSGKWKDTKFLKFSPNTRVPQQHAGRFNLTSDIIEKIRRTFLEMGFKEASGPYVESTFWDFDSLFVPQDHPARDMQDTFYIDGEEELPKIWNEVAEVHRNSWGHWDKKEAMKKVLRTHTTAVSARMLSESTPPLRVFCIDKSFRNETVDYKHLAEFYQVEGIVFDKNVNFNNLVGYLKSFFGKLGIDKIRIRPGYFPYTEMSAEVDVWFEPKNDWMELGGAGIFRPEVVKPLTGLDYPVLAWGLSIARVVMLKYNIKDIRELYRGDLNWLRNREVFR